MKVKCPHCGSARNIRYRQGLTGIALCASCAQRLSPKKAEWNKKRGSLVGTELRRCIICKKILPLSEFHKNKANLYGREYYCKKCNVLKSRDYRERHPGLICEIAQRSYLKHKERANSRALSHYFYPQKQQCSYPNCNSWGESHHDDYDKPREIVWLCKKHHSQLHNGDVPHTDIISRSIAKSSSLSQSENPAR